MKKIPLIGASIVAVVVLLILGSLSNVVGFQTIQSSNQKVMNDEVDQKELLFQTILDIANNKEIQKVILNSELKQSGFFNPGIKISVFTPHVLTKKFLNTAYNMGVLLSKAFSPSRMHSMLERYQMNHEGVQKEITTVIKNDATLNGEITQLSSLKCNCGNDNISWNFPVLCTLLIPIMLSLWLIAYGGLVIFHVNLYFFNFLLEIIYIIGLTLNCSWKIP
jgi:hypothetical protein